MGNSGAIRAGRAYVEIFGDDSPLQRVLNKASGKMKSWGGEITSIGTKLFAAGAAITASFGGAVMLFSEVGSQIHDMGLRTGISAESLSTLGYAAGQSGVGMDELEGSIRKMQKNLGGAAEGSAEAGDALAHLGLTIDEIKGLAPDEQFRKIGAKLAEIQDPTMRAAEAMKIFGKSGTGILPMLGDLAQMEKQARELGLVWSQKDADAADSLGDAMAACWETMKRVPIKIVASMADSLTTLVTSATKIAVATGAWIQENASLVAGIVSAGVVIAGAGAAMIVLGTVLTAGATILATVGAALAAITSTAGLTTLAVAGVGGALLYYSGIGGTALDFISDKFGELKAVADETFKGISDALSAGDIAGAMEILWLTLKTEWASGTQGLMDNWTAFKVGFQQVALDAFYGVLQIANDVWATMRTGWADFIHFFETSWTAAQNSIANKTIDIMAYFDPTIDAADAKGILNDDFNREQRGRDAAHKNSRSQIEKDRQAREDDLAQQNIGANAGLGDAGRAEILERQRQLDDLRRDRDAAIAHAASNRKDPTDLAKKHDDIVEAATGSKHGPIAGVDISKTEGFKAVLAAVNNGRVGPDAVAQMTRKQLLDITKRQQKDIQKMTNIFDNLGVVGV